MLNSRKSINTSDLPLAESTHIEDATRTPKSSMLSWSRFGLRNNSSPIPNHSQISMKRGSQTNKSTLGSLIDPRVVLDAQSNGFASRVVKYHDESEAKTREISNKIYRRPGDFPIVNLDRTEHNLKARTKGTPHLSSMSLSTPINLVSSSERSAIFRTGKNLGETLAPVQHEPSLRLGKAQNEPIITPSHEYDNGLACSSLDALKEISRKRIHCDELDSDFSKKQKPEYGQSVDVRDSVPSTSKRTRDRLSPTTCSPVQAQKKRYRNNDILSSLSSSISMGLKRTASVLSESTPIARSRSDEAKENATRLLINEHAHLTSSIAEGSPREAINRIGKSISDIPPCQTSKPPEQVLKSMSDSSVVVLAKQDNRKPPKFTLFNKAYNRNEPAYDGSDAEEDKGSVSYVKPKARATSLFSKNRDPAKSKLSMMLNFLRGQDSTTDEVDAVQKGVRSQSNAKADTKVEPKTTVESKTDNTAKDGKGDEVPNLLGGTKVTFSTATTTSVLNAPASTASSAIVETPKKDSPASIAAPAPEPINKPLSLTTPVTQATSSASISGLPKLQFPTAQVSAAQVSIAPVVSVTSAAPLAPSSIQPTVTSTALPLITPIAAPAIPSAIPAVTTTGLSFSATAAAASTQNAQHIASSTTASFSFGAKTTGATSDKPPPPAYGSQPAAISAAAPSFTFGQAAAKPATAAVPTFGSAAAQPALTSVPTFGAAAAQPTSTNAAQPVFGAATAKPATSPTAPSFVFGASNISKPGTTPAFGSNNPAASGPAPTSSTATPFGFGTAKSNPTTTASPSFQFGGGAQSTAASTTNAFGAPAATTNSPSTNLFGSPTANKTTTQAPSPFAFGQNASKPATLAAPSFGATAAAATPGLVKSFAFAAPSANTTPAASSPFGATTNKPATQSASPFAFGASSDTKPAAAAAPPAFGQQSSAFSFASPKATTTTPNPSPFGTAPTQQAPTPAANPFGMSQSNQPNSMSTTASNASAAPAFGGSPFGFSANTNTGFGGQTQAQNAASPFGSASTSNNIFSSTASSGPATAQGASNVFGFGQAATTQQPSASATNSVFGSNNTTPAFGSPANNAVPAFGSSASNGNSGSGGAFNFSASKPANPVFGSATNNQQSTSSFSFTAAANNNSSAAPSPFGNASNNNSTAPSPFGNANNNSVSGSGSAFAFGGMNQNNNDAPKPFNFGAAAAPAQSAGGDQPFAFGAPTAVASVPNAFQFSAQPQANNIFSITPTAGAAKPRPVRALARRNK